MLLKHLLFFFLASTTLAILPPRDASTILTSLNTLSTDLSTLQKNLQTFQGGVLSLGQALQIQTQATQLVSDTKNAASASSSSAPLDDAGTRSVAFKIIAISQQIFSVLDLLVTKKGAFESTLPGASKLVENDLEMLKNGTDDLAAKLTPKFVPSVQKLAPLLVSDIDFHFVRAIDVYSS
ncbi:hydrophobic surface binding protein A-domain-containing protein [Rhexocercosporidium sp. MPI-PUGE-AT-0058]|nr:hydrophobic surface binding protein A-domain-containing protein [Rhexocercosporidium sp. MPI-PUGE-AT-0058]